MTTRLYSVPLLRRSAHRLLLDGRFAVKGGRWDAVLPPHVAAAPTKRRARLHGRQEGRRLAAAALYDVREDVAGNAVRVGAHARTESLKKAASASADLVIDVAPGLSLPQCGFLRWRGGGVSYAPAGAPIVACHWGPAMHVRSQGLWVAWWALHDTVAAGPALDYVTGMLLPHPLIHGSCGLPRSTIDPFTARITSVLLFTTLTTWALLANASGNVTSVTYPVPDADALADHDAGISARTITHVSLRSTGQHLRPEQDGQRVRGHDA